MKPVLAKEEIPSEVLRFSQHVIIIFKGLTKRDTLISILEHLQAGMTIVLGWGFLSSMPVPCLAFIAEEIKALETCL